MSVTESQSLNERKNKVLKEFENLTDWESRYRKLIDLGKTLPPLDESLKTEEARVRGCQSQVWLHARLNPQGLIEFQGDSDAVLVRGLVALVLRIYSGSTPQEILLAQPDFIQTLGFDSNLSPSRANGLHSMIKQVKNFALAFSLMQSKSQGKA